MPVALLRFVAFGVIATVTLVIVLIFPNWHGARSANDWPVLSSDSSLLYRWKVPGQDTRLRLRRGPVGFLLTQHALWYSEEIGRLDRVNDDYGYAHRYIAGTGIWSNHASGTAIDLNFTLHPRGYWLNYSSAQVRLIHARLDLMRHTIRWGGDYNYPDAMHWEINAGPAKVRRLVNWLMTTERGQRVLAANPKAVPR